MTSAEIQAVIDHVTEAAKQMRIEGAIKAVIYTADDGKTILTHLTDYEIIEVDRALYGDVIAAGNSRWLKENAQ